MRWSAANDKAGREHWTPLTKESLDALKVAREHCPALGYAWLLPSPQKPEVPLNRDTLAKWFRKATAVVSSCHREPVFTACGGSSPPS